jgi:hypothetical protein
MLEGHQVEEIPTNIAGYESMLVFQAHAPPVNASGFYLLTPVKNNFGAILTLDENLDSH